MTHLEEIHGEMNSVAVSVLDLEVSRPCSTSSENDGVRLLSNGGSIDIDSNVGVGDEVLQDGKKFQAQQRNESRSKNNGERRLTIPSAAIRSIRR